MCALCRCLHKNILHHHPLGFGPTLKIKALSNPQSTGAHKCRSLTASCAADVLIQYDSLLAVLSVAVHCCLCVGGLSPNGGSEACTNILKSKNASQSDTILFQYAFKTMVKKHVTH